MNARHYIMCLIIMFGVVTMFLQPFEPVENSGECTGEQQINGEQYLIVTGRFKVTKITPVRDDVVLTLVNTDVKQASSFIVSTLTNIHYQIGDMVTARITFLYLENQKYHLFNIQLLP